MKLKLPFSMRVYLRHQLLHPDHALPEPEPEASSLVYLSCMISFARFGGEVWDQAFSVASQDASDLGEKISVLDARIQYWVQTSLPTIPLLPHTSVPSRRHLRQQSLVRTVCTHAAAYMLYALMKF